jgi:transposase
MAGRSSNYPRELRERAVRMVAEVTPHYPSPWAAMHAVATKLGIGSTETLRKWVRRAEVDAGQRPGSTSEENAEIRRLKREVAELRRANAILKTASAFFAAELCATRRCVCRGAVRDRPRWAVAAA